MSAELRIDALLPQEMAARAEYLGARKTEAPVLTWGTFLLNNLLPVTIGNIIGGTVLVGAVYWSVFLRRRSV